MDQSLKRHLTRRETWLRGLFIILFAVIYGIAEVVLWAVVLFQFLATLFTGERNPRLLRFGAQLCAFLYQVLMFVTFNRDRRPWPFDPWPGADSPALPEAREP